MSEMLSSLNNKRTPPCAVETHLSDGSLVCLRTIRPSDEQRIREGIMEMSDRSRYFRFFSAFREPPDSIVKRLSAVDGHDHIGWGAILLDGADHPPIGAAHAIRMDEESDTAELAVALLDDYQGLGLARILIAALLVDCVRENLSHLEMQVMADNSNAAGLFLALGAKRTPPIGTISHYVLNTRDTLHRLQTTSQPAGVNDVLSKISAAEN